MPDNVLDSDFRRDEELPSKKESKAWWASLMEDGEEVLMQQHILSNKWSDNAKTPIKRQGGDDVFFTVLGASITWHVSGLILLYILGDSVWLTTTILGLWLLALLIAWAFYKSRRKAALLNEQQLQNQELILTPKRLMLENGGEVFLEDILAVRMESTKLIVELKRPPFLELEIPDLVEAKKLLEAVQQLQYR